MRAPLGVQHSRLLASQTMARLPSSLAVFSFFIIFSAIALAGKPENHIHRRTKKTTHLHFYFQEINGGANPSVVRVAQANGTDASPNMFGAVAVADNPLTEGPELTSRLVGRAQGMYASASQQELALMMSLNFVFVGGKYNGSALTILGRNPTSAAVRELSIVGGSGYFRLARGYALFRIHGMDPNTGVLTAEYNVTVTHR